MKGIETATELVAAPPTKAGTPMELDDETHLRVEETRKKVRTAIKRISKCTQKQSSAAAATTLASESVPILQEVAAELEALEDLVKRLQASNDEQGNVKMTSATTKQDEKQIPTVPASSIDI